MYYKLTMIACWMHLANVQELQTKQDDNMPLKNNEHRLMGGLGHIQHAPLFYDDVILIKFRIR